MRESLGTLPTPGPWSRGPAADPVLAPPSIDARLAALTPGLVDVAAVLTLALGATVLAGWFFQVEAFTRVMPGLPSMKANSALSFMASGAALWLLNPRRRGAGLVRAGAILAWIPALMGLATAIEYGFGIQLGLDELLVADPGGGATPGRPSPITALTFALAGGALLTADRRWPAAVTQAFAAIAATLSLLGLLGYLYDATLIRNARGFTSMAIHTVVGFHVLLAGVLLLRPEEGFMRLLLADDAGGISARRMVPAVMVAGVLFGWVRIQAQRLDLIDTNSGVALLVTAVSGFVVLLALRTADVISRKDRALKANLAAVSAAEKRSADYAASLQQVRQRLGLALRSGNQGVWDWDVKAGTIGWDEQMYRLYALAPGSEVRYETWSGAVLPEDLAEAEANLRRAMDARTPTNNLFRIRLPDGRIRHIAASQDVVLGESGEVLRVIGVNRDVTDLREAEARLRASEEKMRLSFRYSAVGAAIVSLAGRFDEVNDAFCAMVGYTPGELTALTFHDITHADDLAGDLDLVSRLTTGEIASYQLQKRYLHKSGRVVWVRISVALARDAAGGPQHFIVQIEDSSERQKAQEDAARVLRELESFSYSVAHDLRAPLRAISGFTGLLGRRPAVAGDAEARDLMGRIVEGASHMGRLIDDLLQLSRVERAEFRREPVDLGALALQIYAHRTPEPDRKVELRVEPGLVVEADPGLMRIALENLLGNALKYTRHCPVARIEVGAHGTGRTRSFYVRDNGVGFDMAYASKLFKPFQRLHSPHEFEGTGIGLATVQRVIERHGGHIAGEGRVGHGATFTFTLEAT